MHAYHSGVAAITPYLEIERDNSTTAFNNDEVWSEWTYKGTSGSTRLSFADDRNAPLTANAAQAAGAGLSAWTGESGTAWSGKLDSGAAITPAEIGHLSARVCVGGAHTVYVDPQIRGRS